MNIKETIIIKKPEPNKAYFSYSFSTLKALTGYEGTDEAKYQQSDAYHCLIIILHCARGQKNSLIVILAFYDSVN